jgi:hypothetical protein
VGLSLGIGCAYMGMSLWMTIIVLLGVSCGWDYIAGVMYQQQVEKEALMEELRRMQEGTMDDGEHLTRRY